MMVGGYERLPNISESPHLSSELTVVKSFGSIEQ